MKNTAIFFLTIATLSLISCSPDPETALFRPPSQKTISDCLHFDSTTTLKVFWQKTLLPDTTHAYCRTAVFDDKLLVAYQQGYMVKAFDTKTGFLLWQTEDPTCAIYANLPDLPRSGNELLLSANKKILGFNLDNGSFRTLLEARPHTSLRHKISTVGDRLFYSLSYCDDTLNYTLLLQTNPKFTSGERNLPPDTLFSASIASTWAPSFSPPIFCGTLNGDSLVAFTKTLYNTNESHVDLLIYNLATRQIIKKITDINEDHNSTQNLFVVDGKILIDQFKSLSCINVADWNELWRIPQDMEDLVQRKIADGIILTESTTYQASVKALRLEDGQKIWSMEGLTAGEVFEDRLFGHFYDKIRAVDLATGYPIWSAPTPNVNTCNSSFFRYDQPAFDKKTAFDETNGCLFATDGYFLMCIKLPEH